jgi:hypothetical protein
MLIIIILVITLLILLVFIYFLVFSKKESIEHFYDITPYQFHWDIFKCLDAECIRNKSYECYNWCYNIEEPGAKENCKMRCSDYADEQTDNLKLQHYQWNYLNPRFEHVSLLYNPYVEKESDKQLNGLIFLR